MRRLAPQARESLVRSGMENQGRTFSARLPPRYGKAYGQALDPYGDMSTVALMEAIVERAILLAGPHIDGIKATSREAYTLSWWVRVVLMLLCSWLGIVCQGLVFVVTACWRCVQQLRLGYPEDSRPRIDRHVRVVVCLARILGPGKSFLADV